MTLRGSRARPVVPPSPGVARPQDRLYRRAEARPVRRRRVGQMAWRAAAFLAASAALAGAVVWTSGWLNGSPLLQIERLRVRGVVRLAPEAVEALVADLRGQNILAVDLERFRRRLLDSPWVAHATLSRRLPSTIEIGVAERVPMAIARFAQQLYLVDRTGVIIDEYGPQYREFDLPIVDGLIAERPAGAGPALDAARLDVTARLIAALAAAPPIGERVSQVDVSDAHDVVVLLDDDPARLHVGDEGFVERLQHYLELAPALREQLAAIDYVDLRFGDRVFARAQGRTASVRRTAAR